LIRAGDMSATTQASASTSKRGKCGNGRSVWYRGRSLCSGLILSVSVLTPLPVGSQPLSDGVHLCVLSQSVLMRDSAVAHRAMDDLRVTRDKMMSELSPVEAQYGVDAHLVDQLVGQAPSGVIQAHREELARRRAAIDARREVLARELAGYNDRLTALVTRAAGPAINAEERARKCSILLSREYLLNVADTTLDITNGVIARMNAPVVAAPPARHPAPHL